MGHSSSLGIEHAPSSLPLREYERQRYMSNLAQHLLRNQQVKEKPSLKFVRKATAQVTDFMLLS